MVVEIIQNKSANYSYLFIIYYWVRIRKFGRAEEHHWFCERFTYSPRVFQLIRRRKMPLMSINKYLWSSSFLLRLLWLSLLLMRIRWSQQALSVLQRWKAPFICNANEYFSSTTQWIRLKVNYLSNTPKQPITLNKSCTHSHSIARRQLSILVAFMPVVFYAAKIVSVICNCWTPLAPSFDATKKRKKNIFFVFFIRLKYPQLTLLTFPATYIRSTGSLLVSLPWHRSRSRFLKKKSTKSRNLLTKSPLSKNVL